MPACALCASQGPILPLPGKAMAGDERGLKWPARRTDGRGSLHGSLSVSTSAAGDETSVVSLLSVHGVSLI